MGRFTTETIMGDVFLAPEFAEYQKYLIYSNAAAIDPDNLDDQQKQMSQVPLSFLKQIGWSPEGIVKGLNFLAEAIAAKRTELYFIYDESEITDGQQKDVNLYRLLPERLDPDKDTIILAAGGAYGSVCTMVEALPTARHFVEAGYQVFLFTYRVGVKGAALLALDDMARAVKYLCDNADRLSVDPDRLVIGGYSAGANLISNWGAPNVGYKKYGMPKPKALFPIYTFIDLKTESKRDENGGLLAPMFGENFADHLADFNIVDHIDADYPPCYIVCGRDDNTVPCANSEMMKERLDAAGVSAVLDEGEHAAHGFGDGTGTDVEGWPERAIAFIQTIQ